MYMQTEIDGIQIIPAPLAELVHTAALRAAMATEMGHDWDEDHPGWRERFMEYFGDKQKSGQAQLFHAHADGKVIGIAIVSLVDDYHSHARGKQSGRINCVYVVPEYRRRGIARAVMHETLEWLRSKGCVVARLNSSEEGAKLYESIGFVPRREMEFIL